MFAKIALFDLIAGAALLGAGCSGGTATGEVLGEVLLDGQPLSDGVVHFIPLTGQSKTESTFIKAGHFAKQVPVGKHRVEISCVQARPLRPGQDADSGTGIETVPQRYNTKSELEAEVKKGKNPLRLELQSKGTPVS